MTTDLVTIHDYESHQEVLEDRYATAESSVNAMLLPTAKYLSVELRIKASRFSYPSLVELPSRKVSGRAGVILGQRTKRIS